MYILTNPMTLAMFASALYASAVEFFQAYPAQPSHGHTMSIRTQESDDDMIMFWCPQEQQFGIADDEPVKRCLWPRPASRRSYNPNSPLGVDMPVIIEVQRPDRTIDFDIQDALFNMREIEFNLCVDPNVIDFVTDKESYDYILAKWNEVAIAASPAFASPELSRSAASYSESTSSEAFALLNNNPTDDDEPLYLRSPSRKTYSTTTTTFFDDDESIVSWKCSSSSGNLASPSSATAIRRLSFSPSQVPFLESPHFSPIAAAKNRKPNSQPKECWWLMKSPSQLDATCAASPLPMSDSVYGHMSTCDSSSLTLPSIPNVTVDQSSYLASPLSTAEAYNSPEAATSGINTILEHSPLLGSRTSALPIALSEVSLLPPTNDSSSYSVYSPSLSASLPDQRQSRATTSKKTYPRTPASKKPISASKVSLESYSKPMVEDEVELFEGTGEFVPKPFSPSSTPAFAVHRHDKGRRPIAPSRKISNAPRVRKTGEASSEQLYQVALTNHLTIKATKSLMLPTIPAYLPLPTTANLHSENGSCRTVSIGSTRTYSTTYLSTLHSRDDRTTASSATSISNTNDFAVDISIATSDEKTIDLPENSDETLPQIPQGIANTKKSKIDKLRKWKRGVQQRLADKMFAEFIWHM